MHAQNLLRLLVKETGAGAEVVLCRALEAYRDALQAGGALDLPGFTAEEVRELMRVRGYPQPRTLDVLLTRREGEWEELPSRSEKLRLGRLLRRAGWTRHQHRAGGGARVWIWLASGEAL